MFQVWNTDLSNLCLDAHLDESTARGGSVDSQPGSRQVGVGESTSRSARGAREENLGGGSRQPAAGMSEQFHNFEKSAGTPNMETEWELPLPHVVAGYAFPTKPVRPDAPHALRCNHASTWGC